MRYIICGITWSCDQQILGAQKLLIDSASGKALHGLKIVGIELKEESGLECDGWVEIE